MDEVSKYSLITHRAINKTALSLLLLYLYPSCGLSAQASKSLVDINSPVLIIRSESESLQDLVQSRRQLPFKWRGEKVVQDGDSWSLTQGVIETDEFMMLADHFMYDNSTEKIIAHGNIKIILAGLDFYSERINLHVPSKSGTADFVKLDLQPTWKISADKVNFTNFRQWNFEAVMVSPCSEINPGWSASMTQLKLDLDNYAQLWNLRLAIGDIPIPIYLPYMIYPANTERTSGLLPPTIGTSSTLGTKVGLSYYQVFGQSSDATISPTWLSKEGILWGTELRWFPSLNHKGSFSGEIIDSISLNKYRYRFNLVESYKDPSGWSIFLRSNESSDSLMEIDYGTGIGSASGINHASNLYAEKVYDWGRINLEAYSNRTFIQSLSQGDLVYNSQYPTSFYKRLLPELSIQTKPISFKSSFIDFRLSHGAFNYVTTNTNETKPIDSKWQRSDLAIHLYGSLFDTGPFRWSYEALGRGTLYSHSYSNPVFDISSIYDSTFIGSISNDNPFELTPKTQNRLFVSGKIEAKLPQYGRIYKSSATNTDINRYKHIVEPYLVFLNNSEFNESPLTPRFDAVDSFPGIDSSAIGEKSIAIGINQFLMIQAFDQSFYTSQIKFDLSAKYHYNPIFLYDGTYQDGWGSIDGFVGYQPSRNIRLSLRNSSSLSTRGSDRQASIDYVQNDNSFIGMSYFRSEMNLTNTPQHGLQLAGLQRLFSDKFRLEYKINYTLSESSSAYSSGINYGEVGIAYVEPCRAFIIKISKAPTSLIGRNLMNDTRIDLIISLRGLGNLFDFRR